VAEVLARRLGSPLDSLLKLTNAAGKELATNDDHEDKGAGVITHHADSRLTFRLPKAGSYFLHVGDTQGKGGPAHAYRLRIGPPRPDFALRLVPSHINARPGTTVPLTVHALRQDGFAGEIRLKLTGVPPDFVSSGNRIPAGQDKVRMTLTIPAKAQNAVLYLSMEGRAVVAGKELRRVAVPAEDRMQAFLWRHLVVMTDCVMKISGRRRWAPPLRLLGKAPVALAAGQTSQLRMAGVRGPLAGRVQLELSDPPEGVALKKVSPGPAGRGLVVLLHVDAAKARPGVEGNLIFSVFMMQPAKGKDGKPVRRRRRWAVGVLPAAPFKIVAAGPAGPADR